MNIGFASDHAGYELKSFLLDKFKESKYTQLNYTYTDFGTNSLDSVDYPDYAHLLAEAIQQNKVDLGIAICFTGNGINIALNRHKGVRAALCWLPQIAQLARQHNDANICTLPGHYVDFNMAWSIVENFLDSIFEEGRHFRRVCKIEAIE